MKKPRTHTRVCGKTCHHARGGICKCWCGGLFHGAAGEEARAEFRIAFRTETIPSTERGFREATAQGDLFSGSAGDDWRARLAATRATPDADNPEWTAADFAHAVKSDKVR